MDLANLSKLLNLNEANRPKNVGGAYTVRSKQFNELVDELADVNEIQGVTFDNGHVSIATANIVAAGSAQGDATALTGQLNFVTGADAAKGVILPSVAENKVMIVVNTANAVLKIYPASGEKIQGGTANANISLAAYGVFIAGYKASGDWYATEITGGAVA